MIKDPIAEYYEHGESDKVSMRIVQVLSEKSISFYFL